MADDESNNEEAQNEVLSQDEVERLLAQVDGDAPEGQGASRHAEPSVRPVAPRLEAQPYDFRQPMFLSQNELRKLRLRNEEFVRSLAARFSIYLRMEFSLQLSNLHTLRYDKFVDGLANPTHLTLFKAEPLRGICLMDIPPRLGLTLVDRLLGGPAHSVNLEREMSEIEMALLNQSIQIILNEWCSHWHRTQDLRPVVLGTENNPRFLQTAAHDTILLVLAMEARIGDCIETLQFAFPCYTLEPLVKKMNAEMERREAPEQKEDKRPRRWNPALNDVRVPVRAEWPAIRLSARQLANLKPGDVLPLPASHAQNVRVRVARAEKFSGRLGTQDGFWAVELNRILENQ